jgi:WD40 repeat protein
VPHAGAAAAAPPAPAPEALGASTNGRNTLLWQWKCDLTKGRSVTAIAWNHDRTDLAAVGYGSYTFGEKVDGLVAIWSLKNLRYPLWWFHLPSGVTALDFSRATGAAPGLQ